MGNWVLTELHGEAGGSKKEKEIHISYNFGATSGY